MNNRRTPSGDGRGRGRSARPAFRSDDRRGDRPRRDDFRGDFRGDSRRDSRGDFRGDFRGGSRREDGSSGRDSLRAGRDGSRSRYGYAGRDDRRGSSGEGRSYGDRSYGDRSRSSEGRSYGDRSRSGEGRSYGDRSRYSEGRSYGDRSRSSEGRSYGDRSRSGEGRSYGDRSRSGDRSYGERSKSYGDRSYGDRSRSSEGRSYGDRSRSGEGRSYGDRSRHSEGRSYGGDRRPSGDRYDRPYRDTERRRDGGSRGRYGSRDGVQTIGGGRTGGYPAKERFGGTAKPRQKARPKRDPDFYEPWDKEERDTTEVPDGVRLQKVLAQAGVASRRACEEMIGEGRVTVDGQVVRRFGAKVDPAKQIIHVDGKRVPTAPDLVYYALNKPIGVVSTMEDPEGRPSLADYVQELAPRLFHVGRLDTETEGLLLLTNDGELAHRLTHPSYGVLKKYWAKVPGPIPRDLSRRMRQGIELEDGLVKADSFTVVQEHGQQALVEVVLHEGRKHVVRRMLEVAGHRVIDLARIEFGPIKLGRTKPGTLRALSLHEVGELYAAVKL